MVYRIRPREYSTLNATLRHIERATEPANNRMGTSTEKKIILRSLPLSLPQSISRTFNAVSVCTVQSSPISSRAIITSYFYLFFRIFFLGLSLFPAWISDWEREQIFIWKAAAAANTSACHAKIYWSFIICSGISYTHESISHSIRSETNERTHARKAKTTERRKSFACMKYSCNIWVLSTLLGVHELIRLHSSTLQLFDQEKKEKTSTPCRPFQSVGPNLLLAIRNSIKPPLFVPIPVFSSLSLCRRCEWVWGWGTVFSSFHSFSYLDSRIVSQTINAAEHTVIHTHHTQSV